MRLSGIIVAATLPLAAACSHAAQALRADAPAPTPEPVATSTAPAPSAPTACSRDDQCTANELCVSAQCVAITPSLAECRATVHFDFDRSDLRSDDMAKLQRVARCTNTLSSEQTLVEGNCDERGTVQYNVALGFRRAHAVSKYIEDLGTPSSRLSEVSYGKEQPLCSESTEACWAMNRRADVSPGARPKNVSATIKGEDRRERARHASREQPAAVEATASAR